jgi:hypothetical protein
MHSMNEATNEAEETKKKLTEMQEQIQNLSKLVLKKSFEVIENEVEANPLPYIEGADKMTVQEVLFELQKRGYNTWEG